MLDQIKNVFASVAVASPSSSPKQARIGSPSALSAQDQPNKDVSTAFERSGWAVACPGGALETQQDVEVPMVVRVKVRVFTFPSDPREQNSYVVGTMEGGLLPTVGTLALDDNDSASVTFAQLRPRLELRDDDGMIRRSALFQEVLAIVNASPNPHGWPASALQTYWFGYFSDPSETVPLTIPVAEEEAPISKYLNMTTSKQTGDLILIPQTQFGPVCEQCCQGCDVCPPIQRQGNQ